MWFYSDRFPCSRISRFTLHVNFLTTHASLNRNTDQDIAGNCTTLSDIHSTASHLDACVLHCSQLTGLAEDMVLQALIEQLSMSGSFLSSL